MVENVLALDVKTNAIESRVNMLVYEKPVDIIWIYKNIKEIYNRSPDLLNTVLMNIKKIKELDFNTCAIALEEIRSLIKQTFNDEKTDEEIEFVIKESSLKIDKISNDMEWCESILYTLSLPFIVPCSKQVVDIIAFLYTRTPVAEFDDLFEIFFNKKDFIVELNLLKVKLMRERSNNYKCKKCRLQNLEDEDDIVDSLNSMTITEKNSEEENKILAKKEESVVAEVCGTDFYEIDVNQENKNMENTEILDHSYDRPFLNISSDTIVIDTKVIDAKSIDDNVIDTKVTDAKVIDTKVIDAKSIDDNVIDTKVIDAKVIDAKVIDDNVIDDKTTDVDIPINDYKDIVQGTNENHTTATEAEKNINFLVGNAESKKIDLFCKCEKGNACFCASYSLEEENKCLSEAKACLLDLENVAPTFFLDNLSLYLSFCDDEELYERFTKYCKNEYKKICANYIFKLKNKEKINDLLPEMAEYSDIVLNSNLVIINLNTFGMYVNLCNATFGSISLKSIDNYGIIGKLFAKFLNVYRHKKMFNIIHSILELKIESIANISRSHLIQNLSGIVEIFFLLKGKNFEIEDQKELKILESIEGTVMSDEEIITQLKYFIKEIIKNNTHKKDFLKHIAILKYFDQEFVKNIIDTLNITDNNDWRYKRDLLYAYKDNVEMFNNNEILDKYLSDSVFSVRKTAIKIKEMINGNKK